MDITTKEFWQSVAVAFDSSPDKFENTFVVEAYYEAVAGITPEEIKQALKSLQQENPSKMPTPNEIRAAWKGHPVEARERAVETWEKIYRNLARKGTDGACADYKTDYTAIEKSFIQGEGGLVEINRLIGVSGTTYISQSREKLMAMYKRADREERQRAVAQIEAKKKNLALEGAVKETGVINV